MLFLDQFYAFKFIPDPDAEFKMTKLGKIYARYVPEYSLSPEGEKVFNRSIYLYLNVSFQETSTLVFEPQDFVLDGKKTRVLVSWNETFKKR